MHVLINTIILITDQNGFLYNSLYQAKVMHKINKDIQLKVIHITVKVQFSWLTEKSKES